MMKPLSIPHFPLYGQSLIEASAGTGKTFTLQRVGAPTDSTCT